MLHCGVALLSTVAAVCWALGDACVKEEQAKVSQPSQLNPVLLIWPCMRHTRVPEAGDPQCCTKVLSWLCPSGTLGPKAVLRIPDRECIQPAAARQGHAPTTVYWVSCWPVHARRSGLWRRHRRLWLWGHRKLCGRHPCSSPLHNCGHSSDARPG